MPIAWLRVVGSRVFAFLRGSGSSRDLDEELQSHLQMEVEANIRRGMPFEEARRVALRDFGGVAQTAEACVERRGLPLVAALLQDFRFALRLASTNMLFTAAAAIPLAVAIGFITAVFTLVGAVFWRPMGIQDPATFATVYSFSRQTSRYQSTSYSEFRDVVALKDYVASATAYVRLPVNVDLGGGAEQMPAEVVTTDYFRTLGVAPVLGRALGPQDEGTGAPPVTAISYALWQSRFKSSPAALGASVTVNGAPCTVVAVMPPGFVGTVLDWGSPPAFWLPLSRLRELVPAFRSIDFENRRDMRWLLVSARLRAPLPQLQAALDVLSSRDRSGQRLAALRFHKARFFPNYRDSSVRFAALLTGISAAVLLIACFNLANLLLTRVAARGKEVSTRLAIGASPRRVLQQFLTEGMVLSFFAVILGLPLSLLLIRWVSAFKLVFVVPLNLNLDPDWRVLFGCGAAGLITGVIVSLAPALRAIRTDLASGLKGSPGAPSARRVFTLRNFMVVAQVSCAMVALAGATLLSGSLQRLKGARLGYDPHNVLLFSIETLSANLGAGDAQRLYRNLLAELRSRRVLGAALSTEALPSPMLARKEITPVGGSASATSIDYASVSDGYLETLMMPVEAGRGFTNADTDRSPPVAVLNRSAATLLWPGEDALGRRLRIRGQAGDVQIVGIVSDARYHSLAEQNLPHLFLPLSQQFSPQVTVHVRTVGNPMVEVPATRQLLARLAKAVPISDIRTLEQQIDSRLSQTRLAAAATTTVGLVGALLALAGLFAVTAYGVAQQRREIAVRIALGAGHGREMLRCGATGLVLGVVGTVVGLVPALWASRQLRSVLEGLYGPGPDILTLAVAIVSLQTAIVVTSLIAVRQVSRFEPAAILRVQ